jgi:hypothetical protein
MKRFGIRDVFVFTLLDQVFILHEYHCSKGSLEELKQKLYIYVKTIS